MAEPAPPLAAPIITLAVVPTPPDCKVIFPVPDCSKVEDIELVLPTVRVLAAPPVAKLMTNIRPSYYAFLEKEVKRSHKTKRQLIEEALDLYMRELKRQAIIEAYKGMEHDEEYKKESVEMAEWGMRYFLKDIDNANK